MIAQILDSLITGKLSVASTTRLVILRTVPWVSSICACLLILRTVPWVSSIFACLVILRTVPWVSSIYIYMSCDSQNSTVGK